MAAALAARVGGAGQQRPTGTTLAAALAARVLVLAMAAASSGCAEIPTRSPDAPTPGGSPDVGSFRNPDPAPFEVTTPASPRGMASDLHATARCDGAEAPDQVAEFSWTPAAVRGGEQRLVLSLLPNGLDTGAFLQTPPLRADEHRYRWRGLSPATGRWHWRVLTRHGGAWAASDTATFPGVICS